MSGNNGVSPLRINKTPNASPTKAARPLSEIGPTEHRRNSPSFNQSTKKMMFTKESSPFDKSPRLFWKEQTTSPTNRFGSENEYVSDHSPTVLSPKRSSIENLKKASRVKNSSMFAKEKKNEYDPAHIQPLDRPLAAGRPLSTVVQGNAFGGLGLTGLRMQDEYRPHRRGESTTAVPTRDSLSKIPTLSPTKTSPGKLPTQATFSSSTEEKQLPPSPTKSSLASPSRFSYAGDFNADSSVVSTDDEMTPQTPRPLRRHAKSVTFDAAPPTINEYEDMTPAPSTVAESRDGSYMDSDEDMSFDDGDSFDASLEDTEKTPVVLPEDWRHMSPENGNGSLADDYDDGFDSREVSPLPAVRPNGVANGVRHGSTNSDAESRPLPPLPQFFNEPYQRESSPANGTGRSLPSPPPAAGISKQDLLDMADPMSLEDRLRLMNIEPERDIATPTQERQDTHRAQLGSPFHDPNEDMTETEDAKTPRISRESILRKVKGRHFDDYEGYGYDYDGDYSPDRSYGDLDPDIPIPSREASSNFDELPRDQSVDRKENDSGLDIYTMGDTTGTYTHSEISRYSDYEQDGSDAGSVIHHTIKKEPDDDESMYSQPEEEQPTSQSTIDTSGPTTPLVEAPAEVVKDAKQDEMFASLTHSEVDLSLDPLKASFDTAPSDLASEPKIDEMRDFLARPETPQSDQDTKTEEPDSPGSVIHHPIDNSETDADVPAVVVEPDERTSSPAVPEEEATIRGAGGKLKTRPSLIPEDVDMAATRRQVSGTHAPPVPVRSPKRESLSIEVGHVDDSDVPSLASPGLMLDLELGEEGDLSFGLDREFENIIEQQKKGYIMREDTKVVVASSRQFSDEKPKESSEKPAGAPAATRKTSAERKPAWTTEPWNGKYRRRSIRTASGRRAASSGPVPPLPGQESAVAGGLDSVEEQGAEEPEEGVERGRLFVKVVGVKDLDLPLPKTERTFFQLTLDNGLHCVTTSWLDLARSAPIGQEFELVVLDDLEFQLTLQTKLERPPEPKPVPAPVVKEVIHKRSGGAFRNFLSSPKKKKEQERKQQEEAQRLAEQQRQQQQAAQRKPQTAWDLLHNLVGPDGSFARAYVCLKNHENEAYGRPLTVDIPCFNEWAVDDTAGSSVKSKRGGVVRRPPYRVGKLTLQLLYVPRPKNAKDEDMPKSMNACIRELKEAEQVKGKQWEGFLSQQGGDCPYWRRRYFRLDGTNLVAYHETTRQPRANISLARATKVIDGKAALQQPSKTKSGGRRKSAFAEEEEGYMFVEEGFRIRFANGEVIDFYADTTAQKEEWVNVLSETIGKDLGGSRAWTSMVFEKERKDRKRAKQAAAAPQPAQPKPQLQTNNQQRPSSHDGMGSRSVPTSPVKPRNPPVNTAQPMGHARTQSDAPLMNSGNGNPKAHARHRSEIPPPIEKDARHKNPAMPRKREVGEVARRDQVRSMMF